MEYLISGGYGYILNFKLKTRAFFTGVLIWLAYSMLTYTITGHRLLGVITDIISGMAVIAIPVLLFPIFNSHSNRRLNFGYIVARVMEGLLMALGGVFILFPSLEPYRDVIYSDWHIHFFIIGALLFYVLLYRTEVVPKFISIWGLIATILLLFTTVLRLAGMDPPIFQILLLPIVLNELFLGVWLMVRGFE